MDVTYADLLPPGLVISLWHAINGSLVHHLTVERRTSRSTRPAPTYVKSGRAGYMRLYHNGIACAIIVTIVIN